MGTRRLGRHRHRRRALLAMTDGRVYTLDDEIDVIHEDLARARRHLDDLQDPTAIRRQMERIKVLERQLAEACAEQIAAAEGFTQ